MSYNPEDSARPAKRARIDDTSAFTPSNATSANSALGAMDADLEREVRAGITEYVCPDNLGFTGVLKQRYTDFLVNEIGLDGNVLHLTSTAVEEKRKADQSIGVDNGVEKETLKSAVMQEQKAEADMQDAGLGGEITLQVPATPTSRPQLEILEPNEASLPVQLETTTVGAEQEVSKVQDSIVAQILTLRQSWQTMIATLYIPYSASKPQTRLSS